MLKHPTEPVLTSNRSHIDISHLPRAVFGNPQWPIAQPLMRSVLIVIRGVRLNDMIQQSKTETEETIQTLAFKATDPRFDVTIGDWRLVRSLNRSAIRTREILVKSLGELAVTIMDQEAYVDAFILSPYLQISGLLLHPFSSGVVGAGRNKGLPTAQMDEGQDIGGLSAKRRPDGFAEEIRGHHHIHVNRDELPPGRLDAFGGMAVRIRQYLLVNQHPPYRTAAGPDGQLLQLANDPTGSPAYVLFGKTDDQISQGLGQPRSADLTCWATRPRRTSVVSAAPALTMKGPINKASYTQAHANLRAILDIVLLPSKRSNQVALLDGPAAVDDDGLAGDVAGQVADQKLRRGGYFLNSYKGLFGHGLEHYLLGHF